MEDLIKKLARRIPARFYIPGRNMIEGGYGPEIREIRAALTGVEGCVLDLGSGSGEMQPGRLAPEVVALEKSRSLLKHAGGKGYKFLVCGETKKLPFRDGAFPAVIMCKLGHHLTDGDLETTIREAGRVLAPGGRLVFLDPPPPSKSTTFMHNLIARIEIGRHHRTLEDTLKFLDGFTVTSIKNFRKKHFDFYIITCEKPGVE